MGAIRIPHLPAELIPLLDASLPRPLERRQRFSPERLRRIREEHLPWARDKFGEHSGPYRRALLVAALEHARAEAIL
jgi:hypothetical protein